MPGSRTYTAGLDDRAQFRIIGDLESRWIPRKDKVVYFTDQSPTFEFEVENLTDNPLMIECTLYLSYQDDEILETKDFQIAVPPEGTERRDFNVDLLPYQGNVVIGLFGEFPNNGLTTSPTILLFIQITKVVSI